MSETNKILREVEYSEAGCDFVFWCPGCQEHHGIWTKKRNHLGAVWSFNGDMQKPTFDPSLLIRGKRPITPEEYKAIMAGAQVEIPDLVCHSFIRNGQIQFLSDCTHALAGKTVPMEATT